MHVAVLVRPIYYTVSQKTKHYTLDPRQILTQ